LREIPQNNGTKTILSGFQSGGVRMADNRTTRATTKPKLIPPMKATKLLLAAALFTGLATLSLAGPGPQFWAQQGKAQKEQAQVQPKADTQAQACAHTCGCAEMKKV
jgi:hypothetical protein